MWSKQVIPRHTPTLPTGTFLQGICRKNYYAVIIGHHEYNLKNEATQKVSYKG